MTTPDLFSFDMKGDACNKLKLAISETGLQSHTDYN